MLRDLSPIFDLGDRGVIQLPAEVGRLRALLAVLDNVELPEAPHPSLLGRR